MEKGRNTKAPQAFWRLGNAIPIIKLHDHDERLPIDIATGLGAISNNSVINK